MHIQHNIEISTFPIYSNSAYNICEKFLLDEQIKRAASVDYSNLITLGETFFFTNK